MNGACFGLLGLCYCFPRLKRREKSAFLRRMSTVKEIELALARLSVQDLQAVRDWLDDFMEDQMEVSDEFKAKIERAQTEIAQGIHSRSRPPQSGQ